jgi:hypothetical protein
MTDRHEEPDHSERPERPDGPEPAGLDDTGRLGRPGLGAGDELDDAAISSAFLADVGDDVAALLAGADVWAEPSAGLADRIAAEISTHPSEGVPVGPEPGRNTADGVLVAAADRLWSWRQVVLGAAAALVLLFAGVTLLSAFGDDATVEAFSLDLVPTGRLPDVAGEVTVTATDSGIRVDLDAPTLPAREGDRFYEGWLQTDDGLLVPIGTFRAGDGVVLWAGLGLDRAVALSITLEEAVAPDSAAQASSGDVVLEVDFPRR